MTIQPLVGKLSFYTTPTTLSPPPTAIVPKLILTADMLQEVEEKKCPKTKNISSNSSSWKETRQGLYSWGGEAGQNIYRAIIHCQKPYERQD
ncbi:hypothetical protein TNCT_539741 [Trichonephila clavata]|uniref:Uncharacterized protein n=1 Tax=Trichonephila clavata TaxID=2740835 RepID=A0A8X6HT34_TRICU|nr:hypothetical protein TNCT_539741 [Trichonephila clavata]